MKKYNDLKRVSDINRKSEIVTLGFLVGVVVALIIFF